MAATIVQGFGHAAVTQGVANPATPAAQAVAITDGEGNIALVAPVASGDATAAGGVTGEATLLYNGASFDRQRGNLDQSLITAVGATTTQNSADQLNVNGRGVKVVLDMTAAGTGSVTLTVQGKDPASGKYYTILTGAAVAAVSTNVYTVYPGAAAVANVSVNDVLPRTWRVVVTAGNANPTTYTVGASVIV